MEQVFLVVTTLLIQSNRCPLVFSCLLMWLTSNTGLNKGGKHGSTIICSDNPYLVICTLGYSWQVYSWHFKHTKPFILLIYSLIQ
ncbi:hypothetical protein CLU79DRAFT_760819 [Phycomyces nitens]|nr:hypothetical protein CLU79DRAFT_760819 [Phycomyces nitens]